MIGGAYNECGKFEKSLKCFEIKMEIKLDKMRNIGNNEEENWKFLFNFCHLGRTTGDMRILNGYLL